MSDKIMRAFEDQRNNPFQFKHVHQCHSLAELSKVPEPKVSAFVFGGLQLGVSTANSFNRGELQLLCSGFVGEDLCPLLALGVQTPQKNLDFRRVVIWIPKS